MKGCWFMKDINFEIFARKISTRVPVVIIFLALIMMGVHTFKTFFKYKELTKEYKLVKESLDATRVNADVASDTENNLVYTSAKLRGTDLVNLENEYVAFSNQIDKAQSVKQKDSIQVHLNSIVSNMKNYLDESAVAYASQWYFGLDSGSQWYCKTNYDFPNDDEIQSIVLLNTNKEVSYINAYALVDFNTRTGLFSNLRIYNTFIGMKSISDNKDDVKQVEKVYNFASLPAIVWDVTIKDGILHKGYTYIDK